MTLSVVGVENYYLVELSSLIDEFDTITKKHKEHRYC